MRSRGGWRIKPRRITPFVVENYWPGGRRVAALRRHWGSYKPWWEILERINRHPAPRPVTHWQAKMMASHLGLRRPRDIGPMTKIFHEIGPETGALRVRNRGAAPPVAFLYEPVKPEHPGKLRKVGRKPKPPKPRKRKTPPRTATVGLSAVGARSLRHLIALRRPRGKRRRGKGRKARQTAAKKS